jgi:cobalt-zinc-cadmium efflux system outer membrane protein
VVWDVAEDIMPISCSAPAGRCGTLRCWILYFWVLVFAGADILSAQTPVTPSTTGPLTLAGLLQQVSRQHPLMAAARAQIQSAEGSRRTAAVIPNPVLGYQLENGRLPGGDPVPMDREDMFTATLPLEFIYQRGSRVEEANAKVRAAEAEARSIRQRLALDATHSYYETALAQVELFTARELAGWLDSLVDYNRTRASEGVGAEADLIRAQVERDRAWAEVTMKEVDLAHAGAKLASFIEDSVGAASSPSDQLVTIPDQPLPLPATATSSSESGANTPAPSALTDRRPEVQAAQERLAAAGSGVDVARSLLVREVGAMLGLKRSQGTSSLMAGLSLPLPIFDQNGGDVARARAERDIAAAELANTERTVAAEIRGALEGAHLLSRRTQLLAGSDAGQPAGFLARAAEARRISVGAYREGAVPLLQVLDAAGAWGEARMTFYRTLFAQHESVIELMAAQGSDLFNALPELAGYRVSSGATRGGQHQ